MTAIASRQQYLNKEISHRDYYRQFVNEELIEKVERTFGIETLNAALHQDEHLNSIGLRSWDAFTSQIPFDQEAIEIAGENVTRATLVCIAKTAAEVAVDRYRSKHSL